MDKKIRGKTPVDDVAQRRRFCAYAVCLRERVLADTYSVLGCIVDKWDSLDTFGEGQIGLGRKDVLEEAWMSLFRGKRSRRYRTFFVPTTTAVCDMTVI